VPFTFGAVPLAFGAVPFAFGAVPFAFGAVPFAFGAVPFAFGAVHFAFGAVHFDHGALSCDLGSARCDVAGARVARGRLRIALRYCLLDHQHARVVVGALSFANGDTRFAMHLAAFAGRALPFDIDAARLTVRRSSSGNPSARFFLSLSHIVNDVRSLARGYGSIALADWDRSRDVSCDSPSVACRSSEAVRSSPATDRDSLMRWASSIDVAFLDI
jgi:hypothetical protein